MYDRSSVYDRKSTRVTHELPCAIFTPPPLIVEHEAWYLKSTHVCRSYASIAAVYIEIYFWAEAKKNIRLKI